LLLGPHLEFFKNGLSLTIHHYFIFVKVHIPLIKTKAVSFSLQLES